MTKDGFVLTTVLKNGCLSASRTVILFSGSTTRHFRMRSFGSSVGSHSIAYSLVLRINLELTRNVAPFRRHKTVLSLHYVTQHNHLLTMPKRWTADEKCEHDNTTRPNIHLFRVAWCVVKHIALKCFRCQVARRST